MGLQIHTNAPCPSWSEWTPNQKHELSKFSGDLTTALLQLGGNTSELAATLLPLLFHTHLVSGCVEPTMLNERDVSWRIELTLGQSCGEHGIPGTRIQKATLLLNAASAGLLFGTKNYPHRSETNTLVCSLTLLTPNLLSILTYLNQLLSDATVMNVSHPGAYLSTKEDAATQAFYFSLRVNTKINHKAFSQLTHFGVPHESDQPVTV